MDKMTPKEFMEKCVCEGGDLTSGFEYGLKASDLNDDDIEFKKMIELSEKHFKLYQISENQIYQKYGYFEEQDGEG